MEIKILGTGCPKCKELKRLTEEAVKELNLDAKILEVKEIEKIMQYPIMFTPALVVNEKVKLSGKVPRLEEVIKLIKEEITG